MPAKVLIVDDEADFLDLVAHNLDPRLYDVLTANDGVEALNKARQYLPDVILLDLMLPDLDGFSVCEILRHQPSTANIPIVIVTAMSGELPRFSALGSGATCVLRKPVNMNHLRESVAIAAAPSQAEAQSDQLTDDRVGR